jgi:hypothetical protein
VGVSHGNWHVRALALGCLVGFALALPSRAAAQTQAAAGAELTLATGAPAPDDDEQVRALRHGTSAEPQKRVPSKSGVGGGFRGTFGPVFTEGLDYGWFGRIEAEGFGSGRYKGAGPIGGGLVGGELWFAKGGGGGGLPLSLYLGYRTPGVFFSLGFGADWILIDRVNDDTGFGIFAPFGTASLGFEVAGMRILVDARPIYRWQWGAPDRAQLAIGIAVSELVEQRETEPVH